MIRYRMAFWSNVSRVGVWDVQDDIQALIASRDAVDREKLADDGVPLAEVRASRTS